MNVVEYFRSTKTNNLITLVLKSTFIKLAPDKERIRQAENIFPMLDYASNKT